MDEKNNNTPELREQERRRAINELRAYREELLKQIQQSQIEENSTNGKNNTKKLGAHPGTGNFYSSHPTKEDDDSWIMNGGFINQVKDETKKQQDMVQSEKDKMNTVLQDVEDEWGIGPNA